MGQEVKFDSEAFKAFMSKPAPSNEARTVEEWVALVAHWDEREPQTGMPRGILLDDQVIQEIPPLHKIVLGTVQVNTSKDAGQVFPVAGGKLEDPDTNVGLGAPVFIAIAAAAGISFPDDTMALDPASTPNRVTAKVGSLRIDLAGQTQFKACIYTLDIDNKCDIERRKGKPESDVEKYRMNLRENSTGRAITGAMRGAVKAHFGKLRRKWFVSDFQIPLLVPHLVTDMKAVLETPEGRTMFAMQATGLAKVLAFGGSRSPLAGMLGMSQAPQAPALLPAVSGSAETVVDTDDDDEAAAAVTGPQPDPAPAAQTTEPAKTTEPVKVDKAREWRVIYAVAGEAGYTGAQKTEVEAKAKAAAVAAGATAGASSETWTPEQWKAARECFKAPPTAAVLPDDEPAQAPAIEIPQTLEAFVALPDPQAIAVLDELLRTRVLSKPPTKSPADLTPETRARWFDALRTAPVKGQEAA